MERQDMNEEELQGYLDLPTQTIRKYLLAILARPFPEPGQRQEAFNPVETLLCYGLFELLNPHRYGGGNIDQVPDAAKALALFFRRTAGSITNKMLHLDGSRTHSSRVEPLLYTTLAEQPDRFSSLYHP